MIADKLRQAILQAAIQGKLTEQLKSDGDARDLLVKIQTEKAKLIKEGKIKKEKTLPEITKEEEPFDIPDNWCWVRYGHAFNIRSAARIHQSDWKNEGVPFLRGRELVHLAKTGKLEAEIFISEELYNKCKEKTGVPQENDILVSAVGSIGKIYVVKGTEKFYYKDAYILCYENLGRLDANFIKYALESSYSQSAIRKDSEATTVAQLTIIKANYILLPLPPLAEQKRIVARIEALLPELDKLAKEETQLETMQQAFPKAMKDSLLQAAIQGKLTKQLKSDGSAKDLMAKIDTEKVKLVEEGKIKKAKTLPEITEDEKSFEIPSNWEWVRLEWLGSVIGGGTPRTDDSKNWDRKGIPWLTPADMKKQSMYIKCGERFISKYGLEHSSARLLPAGSVLFSSRAPIGYIGIALNAICTNQGFKSIVPYFMEINKYIYFCLMALTGYIVSLSSGTTFLEISGSKMAAIPIPLPPLAEQKRIVRRLEQLLPLCEGLH